jgi:hypothetical protein
MHVQSGGSFAVSWPFLSCSLGRAGDISTGTSNKSDVLPGHCRNLLHSSSLPQRDVASTLLCAGPASTSKCCTLCSRLSQNW